MPAAACTPAARATSRCRSTCGCTCAGASRCCSRSCARRSRRFADQAEQRRRRADAVVHALAARHAGARRALPAEPRRRAAARSCSPRAGARGSRRAAARVGRDRRHRLCDRHRRARRTSRLRARRAQQHGRLVRSRFRRQLPLRVVAGDGAPVAHRRGLHPVHERGVRLLRAGRLVRDRQQHDAAEEESRSAGARARQGGPGHRATSRACSSR